MTTTVTSAPYLITPDVVFPDFLFPLADLTAGLAGSNVETVGVGEEFATLSAAIAAATNGTVIYVNAGTYTNDFATITSAITIIGVGGMVNMVATEPPPNLKGILTVDNNVTIENLSFSGAAIDEGDGGNGAGIRYEGGIMVLENDAFMNNQNGVMGAPVIPSLTTNTVTINHCFFYDNGAGDGYTHNAYIGDVSSLTFTDNISTDANVGHELKSRAQVNTITGNVFADGPNGDASYEIDLPNGGTDLVEDNIIEKGPNAQNNNMVHFGGEGIPYAGSSLTVEDNTFENDTGGTVTAVLNQTAISVTISGNTFDNIPVGDIASGPAVETNNVDGNGNPLPDSTLVGVLPGSTLMITDGAPHTVSLTGNPYYAVEGDAGLLTVTAVNGHIVAIGGSGGMVYSEASLSGGNQITTQAGATDTIELTGEGGDLLDSEGNDIITVGVGNLCASLNGTAYVADGPGNNQYSVNGTAMISGQGGNPEICVGPNGNLTFTGPVGFLKVDNNGGTASFDITEPNDAGAPVEDAMSMTGGAADIQVYQSGSGGMPQMNITTAAGTNGATIWLRTGSANITSAGADTIYAGADAASVIVEGAATVWAGVGALSVYGRSDSVGAVVYGAGGEVTLSGDTGDITYYGGAQANTVDDVLSNDTLIGGAGLMTVIGGSHETITGGAGGLIYTSQDDGGANTITTMAGSINSLHLAQTDTVISNGTDTILGGSGNSTFTLNGTALLVGSTGNSQVIVNGRATIYGLGQDWVTVNQGASATIFSCGQGEYVSETHAAVNIYAGTGALAGAAEATVTGGSASLSASASGAVNVNTQGGATVTAGSGAVNISSAGNDLIYAGVGADVISIDGTNTQVWGGNGALTTVNDGDGGIGDTVTVHGESGALIYNDGGYGTLTFIGGAGSAVINGGGGGSMLDVTAGSGSMTVSGGAGTNFIAAMQSEAQATISLTPRGGTIEFGAGMTAVSEAGWEVDPTTYQFVMGHGGGIDTINSFLVGTDRLSLGAGVTMSSATVSAGATTLTLSDGTSVTLNGVHGTAQLFG